MVTDHRKSLCDRQKTLSNGHHDHHYLDIATTFINFNSLANSSKTIFAITNITEICNVEITVLES